VVAVSYDFYYWSIMSAGFILTGVLGVGIMFKTQKMLLSFIVSLLVNLAVFGGGSLWWAGLFEGFSRMFGLFGFGIAFVNIEVLLLFGLFIMRKKAPAPTE
jgi:hypothetical protein